MDSMTVPSPRFPLMKLVMGVTLFFLGALYTLDSLGLVDSQSLGRLWPVILIALGIAMEGDAIRRGRFGCGLVMIGVGTWLLAGSYHLFGLTYETAVPMGVIVVGFGLVIDSVMEGRISSTKENDHARRL